MTEMVEVRVGDCACPDTPHENGDIVYIRPTLGLVGGLEAQRENNRALTDALREVLGTDPTDAQFKSIQDDNSPLAQQTAVVMGELLINRWVPVFIRHGATGWNFLDAEGKPRPFDVSVLLDDFNLGKPVADTAADLYADILMRPLVERLATLSPPTSTNGTHKATRRSRTSTRKRRSSSSEPVSVGQPSVTSR